MFKSNLKNTLYWLTFFFFLSLMSLALFGLLGVDEVCSTDEATHGINAYEMIQNKNLWINTLKYETDYYNSKPPLMLWLIILGYKLFGFTPLGMRFFSAVAGLFIYLLIFFFLFSIRKKMQALLFFALLPACTLLFEFHMFRSGDMDSVYTLFFLLAVLSLYWSYKTPPFLLLYGAALGFAFLCKGTHFVTLLAVGLLFFPFLLQRSGLIKAVLYFLLSYLTGILVVLPWAVVRFLFDGTRFFSVMLFSESIGRVTGNLHNAERSYFSYFLQLVSEPICLFLILTIIFALILSFKEMKTTNRKMDTLTFFKKRPYLYLMISWFVIVIGFYSITKSGLEWYIYSAYLPLLMLGVEALCFLCKRLYRSRPLLAGLLPVFVCILSTFLSVNMILHYPWQGSGGSPRISFHEAAINLRKSDSPLLPKQPSYIANNYNIASKNDHWEHDYMFYAMTTLDLICKDGGVEAFIASEDENAILFLSKDLWEAYAPVLTGYVILEDSGFLVFSKDRY